MSSSGFSHFRSSGVVGRKTLLVAAALELDVAAAVPLAVPVLAAAVSLVPVVAAAGDAVPLALAEASAALDDGAAVAEADEGDGAVRKRAFSQTQWHYW